MQGCVNIVPSANIINVYSASKQNKNECLRYSNKIKRPEAVPPRHEHSATAVEENIILAYPVDKPNYSNPLYPSGEGNTVKESKPVQATDGTDAVDSSYIVTNFPPRQRSIFGTHLQNGNPLHEVSRVSNTYTSGSSSLFTSSQHPSISRRQINSNPPIGIARDSTAYHPTPPRYPDFISLVNRQSSFSTPLWSVNSKPEVRTLTEYGFFFTGNADLVRCFQCGIGLKDWIKDDDVLAEHIKHSTDCGYLYQKFGKSEIERLKTSLTGQGGGSDNYQTASNNSPLPYKIRSPRYQTMESRMTSFASFPSHLLIDPRTLAVAGLFYTGTGDLCRCFACDGGLKDWSTGDDPVKEHATYFPHCPYINQLKGPEYVTRMQSTRRTNNTLSGTARNGTISQTSSQGSSLQGSQQGENWQRTNQGATARGGYTGARSQDSQSSVPLSMDKLSIESDPSSVIASQVFQQLGYSELDIIAARTELESQGNKQPTSEDIINTILDIQEKTTRQAEGGASGNTGSNDLQAIVEENERLLEMVQCMLCVTGEPDILFLPCAHHRVCNDCAKSLTCCPVCQRHIKEKVKTFRS